MCGGIADGDFVNHDFAEYHIATHADVGSIEATCTTRTIHTSTRWARRASTSSGTWAPRAAVANAPYHATGIRVRELPITQDKVILSALDRGPLVMLQSGYLAINPLLVLKGQTCIVGWSCKGGLL